MLSCFISFSLSISSELFTSLVTSELVVFNANSELSGILEVVSSLPHAVIEKVSKKHNVRIKKFFMYFLLNRVRFIVPFT